MREVGTWWNDKNIDLVEIDGRVFGLDGWNGYQYCHCFECFGHDVSEEEYILIPVYDDDDNIINYNIM